MDGSNPKVSFIPKGSLVREESFLERRRPQSAIGLLAGIVFVLVVSSFVGLYYYNNKLNTIILDKKSEIDKTKQEFSSVPEVAEARVFRARVDLANELLNSHKIVSPVFVFLAKNTTESVLYDKFSLKNDSSGAVLDLGGEAQNYDSLAFQADVLRGKTDELQKFTIDNIALTKFGNVTFNLSLVFKPDFLLYTKNIGNKDAPKTQGNEPATEAVPSPVLPVSDGEEASIPASEDIASTDVVVPSDTPSEAVTDSLSGDWTAVSRDVATTTTSSATKDESMLRKLWSKFKFW